MKKGFTLLELLIVIAIIGILVSITISQVSVARQKSIDTSKIKNVQELRTSLQLFYTDKGYYPGAGNISDLVNDPKKYISSISSSIIYYGLNSDNSVCAGTTCASYHAGTILARNEYSALKSDADQTVGGFNGKTDDCNTSAPSNPDKCYDITP